MLIPERFNKPGVMLLTVNDKLIAAAKCKNMINTIKLLKEDKRLERFKG